MSFKLKPKERNAILAGEQPEIIRPFVEGEPCPFEVGEEVALRTLPSHVGPVPQVWITVLGIARGKKGEWMALYSVRDDRSLYLSRGSGYTRSGGDSIDPEASVEDEATLKAYAAQGRLKSTESKGQKAKRDEVATAKQFARKLARLQAEGARYGVDLTPRFAAMIREAQGEIAKNRAA